MGFVCQCGVTERVCVCVGCAKAPSNRSSCVGINVSVAGSQRQAREGSQRLQLEDKCVCGYLWWTPRNQANRHCRCGGVWSAVSVECVNPSQVLGHEVVTRRMMSYLAECLIHHKAIWQGNKAQSSGILILRYQRQQ